MFPILSTFPILAASATNAHAATAAKELAMAAGLEPAEVSLIVTMIETFGPPAYNALRKIFHFLPPLPSL